MTGLLWRWLHPDPPAEPAPSPSAQELRSAAIDFVLAVCDPSDWAGVWEPAIEVLLRDPREALKAVTVVAWAAALEPDAVGYLTSHTSGLRVEALFREMGL